VPQGLFWSVAICSLVLVFPGEAGDASYKQGVLLHGAAAFIEALSEPAYILSTCLLVFKLQVTVETLASLAKCFTTLVLLLPSLHVPPLVAFGLAALVYSGTLFVGYWAYFLLYKGDLFKKMVSFQHLALRRVGDIDASMVSAYRSFTVQAIEKHFLGEGEKFVMAVFQPPYDQGVYGLVNNLGSIVVRTAFQPFEQAIFTAFSMTSKSKRKAGSLQRQADLLLLLLKLVSVFAGICIAFGPSYSFTLLWFSYGKKWALTEAPRILSVYCFYISAMAFNGVSEAFMHATADEAALKRINASLVAFSIIHSVTSIVLVKTLGTYGLVLAGCVSMLTRVAYCWRYTADYFSAAKCPLGSILPAPASMAAGLVCCTLVVVSERIHIPPGGEESASFDKVLRHFLFGAGLGVTLLFILYRKENAMLNSLKMFRKGKEE